MPASPSLLIVPARFKTGKLYTQIATTSAGVVLASSGDFNFTRATTATRYNSAGLIESVASGVSRLDYYTSGGTAGCPALLVEPGGTNLALQSEAFNTTANWSPVQLLAFNSGSVTNTTGTLDPYGTNVADLIVANTVSDQHRVDQTTVSVSGSYTFSIFLKAAGYNFARLRLSGIGATFNLASGTISSTDSGIVSSIQSYGNGWYRCIISKAASVANEIVRVNILQSASGDFAGDGPSGIYIFGSQYELGTVATSYIPTTTASATRNADVISLSGAVSGCIGQTEGTIYAEVDAKSIMSSKAIVQLDNGTGDNRLSVQMQPTNVLAVFLANAGSLSTIATGTITTGTHKIAVGYNQSNVQIYLDGAFLVSGVTSNYPTLSLTNISVGSRVFSSAIGNFFNDRIRAAALYTTRLTNDQLQALTT